MQACRARMSVSASWNAAVPVRGDDAGVGHAGGQARQEDGTPQLLDTFRHRARLELTGGQRKDDGASPRRLHRQPERHRPRPTVVVPAAAAAGAAG